MDLAIANFDINENVTLLKFFVVKQNKNKIFPHLTLKWNQVQFYLLKVHQELQL